VSENSRICSLHFEGSEKTAGSPLPSIFPWSVSVKHRQPPAIHNPLPLKKQKHEKPPTPTQVKLDVARREIERHEERIVQLQANVLSLEEEVKIIIVNSAFLKRFEGSDSDIQFYTGLSS